MPSITPMTFVGGTALAFVFWYLFRYLRGDKNTGAPVKDKLKDKVVLLTGASSGLGEGLFLCSMNIILPVHVY